MEHMIPKWPEVGDKRLLTEFEILQPSLKAQTVTKLMLSLSLK